MMFDTQRLTRIVEGCLELAEEGELPADTRAALLARGKRLREQLLHLLGARFDADSPPFKQATEALHETNHALAEALEGPDRDRVGRAVERLAELAGRLDEALEAAGRLA